MEGIVYKLCSPNTRYYYVGSTVDLNKRSAQHLYEIEKARSQMKLDLEKGVQSNKIKKMYKLCAEHMGHEVRFDVLFKGFCPEGDSELRDIENRYIDLCDPYCLNRNQAFTTKQQVNDYQQAYRILNRDYLYRRQNTKVPCVHCGASISRQNLQAHQESNKCTLAQVCNFNKRHLENNLKPTQ